MSKGKMIGLAIAGGLSVLTVFHLIHYLLFCRYKGVPGKSHCGACGHRRACRKYHSRKWKTPAALCALLLLGAVLPLPARADSGPKPSVTITVVNAPDEPYYLDLLTRDPGDYDNLEYGPSAPYDEAILKNLHLWENDGWYPAYAGGTGAPLFGDLVGDENGTRTFTYFGLPETFRIACATAESGQAADASYTRQNFYTNLVYDYAANAVVSSSPVWETYLVQFLFTCIPTLLLEGLVLVLFRYSLRKNWKVFLLTNVGTQLGLALVLGHTLARSGGGFGYFILLMISELVIFVAEALIYTRFLKPREGKAGHPVLYALCANAASFALTFLSADSLFTLLQRL